MTNSPERSSAGSAELPKSNYISKGADISKCGKYRYLLWREWRGTHDPKHWEWMGFKDGAGHEMGEPRSVLFVMLNPSTADGDVDDATIRRCVGFAKAWNYERLEVVNLYAFRATKPKDLLAAGEDMYGPRNQEVIERVARHAGIIICAWGTHANEYWAENVRGWMHLKRHHALGFTRSGQPRHPLYLPADARPVLMPGS